MAKETQPPAAKRRRVSRGTRVSNGVRVSGGAQTPAKSRDALEVLRHTTDVEAPSKKLLRRKRPRDNGYTPKDASLDAPSEQPTGTDDVNERKAKSRRRTDKKAGSRGERLAARVSERRAKNGVPEVPRKVGRATRPSRPASSGEVASGASFADFRLHASLLRQLEFLNFTKCTPIQAASVPASLSSKQDVLLRAPTGSGKTLAFLLPVLHQLLESPAPFKRNDGTLTLVLSPTKELALQTLKVCQDLLRMTPHLVSGSIAGGEKPKSEKARIRKGLHILCATPGRLVYHLEHTAQFKVGELRHLILDEADRLLDMGFEPQVRTISKKLAELRTVEPKRALPLQTLLVSATLTPGVRSLAGFLLRPDAFWAAPTSSGSPKEGSSKEEEDVSEFAVPASLKQWYCVVPCKDRLPALIAAIVAHAVRPPADAAVCQKKAIVFLSACASVDFHHDLFLDAKWPSLDAARKAPAKPKVLHAGGGFISVRKDGEDNVDEEASSGEEKDGETPKADRVFEKVPLFKLHGNLTSDERAGYIRDFSKAAGGVLLASDAASRGLDFPQIDWIIQYDPPQRTEEYLHRVGRTARIGRAGNSLLFLQPSELGFIDVLRQYGVDNMQQLEVQPMLSALLRLRDPAARPSAHNDFHRLLAANLTKDVASSGLVQLARTAFLSSMRSYRSFPRALREVFPAHEVHVGHLASSFALRETPVEVARHKTLAFGRDEDKGKGRGKGKGKSEGRGSFGGDGAGDSKRSARRSGKSSQRASTPNDEFGC